MNIQRDILDHLQLWKDDQNRESLQVPTKIYLHLSYMLVTVVC